jgi:archaellum component FlaF (FlaF/FlaG flagellin family)
MTKSLAEDHPELFHYTNAKGLIGIIESQSIWATDYRYLNDSTEIKFFLQDYLSDLLRPISEEFLNELITQDSNAQLSIDLQGGREKVISSYIRSTLDAGEKILLGSQNSEDALAEPYIVSFCTAPKPENHYYQLVSKHGLLSQWRSYGRDGGYAIVFDTARLTELMLDGVGKKWNDHLYLFIGDVVYSSDSGSKLLKEFKQDLNAVKKFHFNHLRGIDDEEILEKYPYSLLQCACRYKHWGFREENEVRIVAIPYASKNKEFREITKTEGIAVPEITKKHFLRSGAMVPFIDLFKGVTSEPDKLLPIKQIIVGPTVSTQEKIRRINAVKMLIDQHNIKAEVTASEIPFVG